jgi:Flp pilus assembly protein TadD
MQELKATADLDQVSLDAKPENLDAIYRLSKYAILTGDYQQAMALIDQAKKIDEDNPGLAANLAVMRGLIGRNDAALTQLNKV